MNILRTNFFKILLLLILSLKVSVFVYDNFTSLDFTVEQISLDFDDSEVQENEVDELKKIVQYHSKYTINSNNTSNLTHNRLQLKYKSRVLEYTTPPPKLL